MKRAILFGLFALAACGAETATGGDTDHVLVVDAASFTSYQESGGSIHWLTPGGDVDTASFAERSQTWDGNGSQFLPCDGQIHWVSTPEVLTISGCVATTTSTSTSTSTTFTTSTTTSTSTSTTSTTQPSPPPPPPSSTSTSTSTTTSTIATTRATTTTTTPRLAPTIPITK